MIQRNLIVAYILFVLGVANGVFVQHVAGRVSGEKQYKDGRKLFLDVSIALAEERFDDAHVMAERLICDYANDYQIRTYLGLYGDTFFLAHKEYREAPTPPVDSPPPKWLKDEVEAMSAKPNKDVLDLVKLVAVGDEQICGQDFPVKYLEEIVHRFPESPWAEWAEWLVIENTAYRPGEKYQDKSPQERYRLLARDMYEAGSKFVEEHPDSHMTPGRLHVMATDLGEISDEDSAKQEAIRLTRRILEEYPTSETHCASARLRLRQLLGEDYTEEEGCSEERDRIISRFYSHMFDLRRYKRDVTQYLSIKQEMEGEKLGAGSIGPAMEANSVEPDLPPAAGLSSAAYMLIAAAGGLVLLGLILLLKKKASGAGK
jgi:hypothetical protein